MSYVYTSGASAVTVAVWRRTPDRQNSAACDTCVGGTTNCCSSCILYILQLETLSVYSCRLQVKKEVPVEKIVEKVVEVRQ
jgi:hypothetical protein